MNICIIGGGGHAKSVTDIIQSQIDEGLKAQIIGFVDDNPTRTSLLSYNRLGGLERINEISKDGVVFCIGIGDNKIRKQIAEKYNLKWFTAIHPKAVVSKNAEIGEGSVIMPGAIINAGVKIGRHVIINSGSVVEHDCKLSDYVHVSPNGTLCGSVSVGEATHIGAGTTIIQNIIIGANVIVGAGSVVVRNVSDNTIVKGVPAK